MKLLAGVLFAFGVLWITPLQAADGVLLASAQKRLAQHLAAVAANEGAFVSPRDLELVWQTTQFNGSTAEKQDRWLRRHSGRVLGTKPCTVGNCLWSRQLGDGTTVPTTVAEADKEYWQVVLLPLYRRLMTRALQLVAGTAYDKPCPIEPRTWGGVGRDKIDDRSHAARDGLYPIGCIGTLNDGFAPRRAFDNLLSWVRGGRNWVSGPYRFRQGG